MLSLAFFSRCVSLKCGSPGAALPCRCALGVLLSEWRAGRGPRSLAQRGGKHQGRCADGRAAEAVKTRWQDSAHFPSTERFALTTWTYSRDTWRSGVLTEDRLRKTAVGPSREGCPEPWAPRASLLLSPCHSPRGSPPQSLSSRRAGSAIKLCANCASYTAGFRIWDLLLCTYLHRKGIKCGID